ncbi:hypothetical protein FQR65_LT07650 [Abscondita terminalis]|nr:hypothetical protein FQR65_LT07650 [Abscondita terminalis]
MIRTHLVVFLIALGLICATSNALPNPDHKDHHGGGSHHGHDHHGGGHDHHGGGHDHHGGGHGHHGGGHGHGGHGHHD